MPGDAVPPDVLDFFRALRDLVDQTVGRLEAAAAEQGDRVVVLTDGGSGTDTLSVNVESALVLTSTVTATGEVGVPEVITAERLAKAKAWLTSTRGKIATAGVAAGAVAWKGAEVLDTLDGLISFAERLLGH